MWWNFCENVSCAWNLAVGEPWVCGGGIFCWSENFLMFVCEFVCVCENFLNFRVFFGAF